MKFNAGDKVSVRYGKGWLSRYIVLGYVNGLVLVGQTVNVQYVFWFNEDDLRLESEEMK